MDRFVGFGVAAFIFIMSCLPVFAGDKVKCLPVAI